MTRKKKLSSPLIIIIIIVINIIIIIIGKDTVTFMQGIYTYIPETNHVPKEYNVAVFCRYFIIIIIIIIII
jgi:hypothetical protein